MPPGTTFETAIQVQPQRSGAGTAYSAELKWDWSVGTGESYLHILKPRDSRTNSTQLQMEATLQQYFIASRRRTFTIRTRNGTMAARDRFPSSYRIFVGAK